MIFQETKQDRKRGCCKLGVYSMLDGEEAEPLWTPWPFIALAHIQFTFFIKQSYKINNYTLCAICIYVYIEEDKLNVYTMSGIYW